MSRVRAWAEAELASLQERGLRRALEPLESAQGPLVKVGGAWLVNFSSNDYLGLANDPRVIEAARASLADRGAGTGASRLVVGDMDAHSAMESGVSAIFGTEAALAFNSGYAANVGLLQGLAGPEDAVFSDALNHASIIDGCRLSRAAVAVYPHADVGVLDRILAASSARRKIVVTDAVFSMDGDHAPLADIVEACDRHGAALVVDEAHAFGVFGARGAGLSEKLGISARVDVRMATLGKSAGSFGAFAATSRPVRELLVNRARSFVFSTALPAHVAAAGLAGARIASEDEARRAKLWGNIETFAAGLRSLGFDAIARSPIFPVVFGTPERALEASRQLRAKGVLVKAIRPPTVPAGTSRLRFSLSAAHDDEHLGRALEALKSLEIR